MLWLSSPETIFPLPLRSSLEKIPGEVPSNPQDTLLYFPCSCSTEVPTPASAAPQAQALLSGVMKLSGRPQPSGGEGQGCCVVVGHRWQDNPAQWNTGKVLACPHKILQHGLPTPSQTPLGSADPSSLYLEPPTAPRKAGRRGEGPGQDRRHMQERRDRGGGIDEKRRGWTCVFFQPWSWARGFRAPHPKTHTKAALERDNVWRERQRVGQNLFGEVLIAFFSKDISFVRICCVCVLNENNEFSSTFFIWSAFSWHKGMLIMGHVVTKGLHQLCARALARIQTVIIIIIG